ncbi:hypothetical protein FBQ97_20510, partial [Acidobacteria bacterium ACD]|nr:hypothetical protein [Acidobacteria bacterium ACD]
TEDEILAGLLNAQEYLWSLGVTGWHEAILGDYNGKADCTGAYLRGIRERGLVQPLELDAPPADPRHDEELLHEPRLGRVRPPACQPRREVRLQSGVGDPVRRLESPGGPRELAVEPVAEARDAGLEACLQPRPLGLAQLRDPAVLEPR